MLAEVAEKYYAQGYNCAESIIRAGNEVYDLHLHDKDMVMLSHWGCMRCIERRCLCCFCALYRTQGT